MIYNGYSEASAIPPGWHGWMHHRNDQPPGQEDYLPREWQKPHLPNQTGTPNAYRPAGSILAGLEARSPRGGLFRLETRISRHILAGVAA